VSYWTTTATAETGNKCDGLGLGPEWGDHGNMSEVIMDDKWCTT